MGTAKKVEIGITNRHQAVQAGDYARPRVAPGVRNGVRTSMSEPSLDQPGEHDPLLRRLHTPRDLREKNWEGVARTYFSVAQTYAAKNDRHIRELGDQRVQYQTWKAEHLQRSEREYKRLLEMIKTRDGAIDQLKATIHLLTKQGS